jgi:glycosyltransferase involved in cell wall biosynthesis
LADETDSMNTGVVAIGRNEGERLRACLRSAAVGNRPVVYVDSGSTDGSVALARSLGVHVVELDLTRPFTAARARNEGFAKLKSVSAVDAVQFVDGDCEIVAGWIEKAAGFLGSNPSSAVVCGRRRERFPDASIYNKLADMEWNTPVGVVKASGGDAVVRVAAFEAVGGYNPAVIAGEEPEMCIRLRQAGWTIHRIDAEMTLHDAAMTKFGQWWKRTIRGGYAYALGNSIHGGAPEFFRVRELKRIVRWAIWPIFLTLAAVALTAVFAPRCTWAGVLVLVVYPLNALRTARGRVRRGDSWKDSLIYGGFVTLGRFPEFVGVRRFQADQRSGRTMTIIEYKGNGT